MRIIRIGTVMTCVGVSGAAARHLIRPLDAIGFQIEVAHGRSRVAPSTKRCGLQESQSRSSLARRTKIVGKSCVISLLPWQHTKFFSLAKKVFFSSRKLMLKLAIFR